MKQQSNECIFYYYFYFCMMLASRREETSKRVGSTARAIQTSAKFLPPLKLNERTSLGIWNMLNNSYHIINLSQQENMLLCYLEWEELIMLPR